MANYSFIGYAPSVITATGSSATLSASYDPDLDRRLFDVDDAAGGNTLGGANGRPDLGLVFDGDRYDNEDGDDPTQTGTAESLDGATVFASGNIYLEEQFTLTKPGGGTIDLYRVEVDGTLVGYITSEPLVPGTSYPSTRSNVVPLNAPDTSDPTNPIVNVPCFTSGTSILTPSGPVVIDALRIGNYVTTADNGPQRIRWIGRRRLGPKDLASQPNARPVLLQAGVLGAKADLLVSPQHGIMVGEGHLVRAKHLAALPGQRARIAHGKRDVTYFHLLFDRHEIVFSNGLASESLYPGPEALRSFANAASAELFGLFPELRSVITGGPVGPVYGDRARMLMGRAGAGRIARAVQ